VKNQARQIEYRDNEIRKIKEDLEQLTVERDELRRKLNDSKELSDYVTQVYTGSQIQLIPYGKVACASTFIRISHLNKEIESQKFKSQEAFYKMRNSKELNSTQAESPGQSEEEEECPVVVEELLDLLEIE